MLIYDAADPNGIPDDAPAVMGYMDGPESTWPAAAWSRWEGRPELVCSVLAAPSARVYDLERGNATADQVAAACSAAVGSSGWRAVYVSEATLPSLTAALASASLYLSDARDWPRGGVYLWAADWTAREHTDVPWAPVQPVAVQYLHTGAYDLSAAFAPFPGLSAVTATPSSIGPIENVSEDGKVVIVYCKAKNVWGLLTAARLLWPGEASDLPGWEAKLGAPVPVSEQWWAYMSDTASGPT